MANDRLVTSGSTQSNRPNSQPNSSPSSAPLAYNLNTLAIHTT
jgi:hypothetical protein